MERSTPIEKGNGARKLSYWFLSFRDAEKNRNLGVSVVQAESMELALGESWLKRCNPGGEVLFNELSEEDFAEQGLKLNRLYSRKEMTDLGFGF